VTGEMDAGVATALDALYSWLADRRNPEPDVPSELLAHLADETAPAGEQAATVSEAELAGGDSVAVAEVGTDVVFLTDSSEGWHVVAATIGAAGSWLGSDPRMLLVLGSDARPGENQQRYRADSVHLVTLLPDGSGGAIVGFPRDSWVEGPDGGIKLSSLMAGRGPEIMLEKVTELSGLPVEGYVVTGFSGFLGLIETLGSLTVDLPTKMRSGNNWADYPAGVQTLSPTLVLRLARIRKGLPRGDFDRSVNQGLIMQAGMAAVQELGVGMLPDLLAALTENTWTDLPTDDLVAFAAAAFLVAPESLTNIVLPGRVGTAGAASVVYLDEEGTAAIFSDLADGTLEESIDGAAE
jgi:LCP family protein required for cell wall assembly